MAILYSNSILNFNVESLISLLSMIIAGYSLYKSSVNNSENSFNERFTLLLEQHDKAQSSLIKYIDKEKNIIGSEGLINWTDTPNEAYKKLYQNHNFSPYMRTLFHILKFINDDFYKRSLFNELSFNKEKKKYSSLIRSLIRNDVLYFVALNSLNNDDSFNKYKELLRRFHFFEHLIVDDISDRTIFKSDYIISGYKSIIDNYLVKTIEKYIDDNVYLNVIYKSGNIKNNEITLEVTFPMIISKLYVNANYIMLKNEVISMLNDFCVSSKMKNIMSELSRNDIFQEEQFLHECTSRYEKNQRYIYLANNVKVADIKPYIISNEMSYINERSESLSDFIMRLGLENNKEYFFFYKELNGDAVFLGNTSLTLNQFYDNCILLIKKNKLSHFIENDIDAGVNDIKNKLVSDINKTALMKSIEEELALSEEGEFFFKIKK